MFIRLVLVRSSAVVCALGLITFAQSGVAQTPDWAKQANRYGATSSSTARSAGLSSNGVSTESSRLAAVATPEQATRAKVTKGSGKLPNSSGQVWREYDIRPYTLRVASSDPNAKPEQAIIDWVLRETGYEAWHSETFGILNANRDTLTVYHTPAMQSIVANIVDRFVNA